MTWCVLDLETQSIPYLGHVSSPHCDENFIVAAGWSIDNEPVQALYFKSKEEALASNWLEKALEGQKYLVAHNAGFEIHWLYHCYPETFMNFIKRGGQIWCTQLAEFMLTHHQDMYPRLTDCSVKYGGDKKIDEVAILWEQGVLTSDIDKALLMSYLASERIELDDGSFDGFDGDVANTRRVCFAQHKLLVEQGMYKAFLIRCQSLLFNAMCTYHGLFVDMEVAKKNQAEQEKQIEQIKANIVSSMPELPDDFEFSFTSPFHKSALLYGGTVQYKAKVSYDPIKYEQVDAYEFTEALGDVRYVPVSIVDDTSIEHHENLYGAEVTKFKSGKNKGQPKVFKIDSTEEKLKWGQKTFKFDGLVNLTELPKAVQDQFLGDRAEYKGANELYCGTPVYSSSGDALDLIAKYSDVAKPLQELAALIKDTGTYYLTVSDTGVKKGMLQFVGENGIINHSLNNCSTVTGRLSSSRPNFQNLPRADEDDNGELKSRVKEMFVSRFGSQGRIVEVDYTALEVVTGAAITDDKNLLEQLQKGTDMHCYRLAFKEGLEYEDVLNRCKNSDYPDHAVWKNKRTAIKTPSFADQYGASAKGVAYAAGCTVEFAMEFQANEAKLFPQFKAFPSKFVRPMVEATGAKATRLKEKLDDGTIQYYRQGYFQANSGNCYAFRQVNQWNGDLHKYVMDYKDTQLANYYCQGEASFIVQAACGRVVSEFIKRDFFGGKALVINTVHDAIYLDCADEETAIEAGKLVQSIMETTPAWLAKVIPALKDWRYDVVPFPAAGEMGANMAHKEHIH